MKLRALCNSLILFASFGGSVLALSFPQNTRLGYLNCQSCHVSPTGGGALKPYGKSTANEFATFPLAGEAQDTPVISGGDLRYLWYKTETPRAEIEDRFLMMADLELGYTWKGFSVVGQYGTYHDLPQDTEASYRHYGLIEYGEFTLRAGKFSPAFGVNTDDHTLPGRNRLGFDARSASYNVELTYQASKRITMIGTGIIGCQGGYDYSKRAKYCAEGEYGGTGQVNVLPFRFLYLSLSGAYLQKVHDGRYLGALGWVIGGESIYTVGEYSKNFTSGVSESWADLIYSWKGFDVGVTRRKADKAEQLGGKLRWIPAPGLELSFYYLIQDENKRQVGVTHLFL